MTIAAVGLFEAKTRLSEFVARAEAGEEVIIARDGVPVVRLMPVVAEAPRRQLGIAEGFVLYMADDFDAELDDFAEYME